MITIEPLLENPFITQPELLNIWPEASAKVVYETTLKALKNEDPGLFLIKKDSDVIGLTGYFLMSDYIHVGLHWHGILQSHRGNRYSQEAMKLVMLEVKDIYPEVRFLVEHIPLTDYSHYIIDYFTNLGFEKIGPIDFFQPTGNYIQSYRIDIEQFLLNNTTSNLVKI